MNFNDCIEFARKAGGCTMATMDGDQPRIRAMGPLWLKEDGIYFTTAASKDLYRQMTANPKVELCFFTMEPLKHLRVTGKVEIITDLSIKAKALEERPFLKAMGMNTHEDPNFVVFKVTDGEAHFWEWGNNLKEKEIPRIKF